MITLSTEDQFEGIKKATDESLSKIFPIVGKKQTLRLAQHWYDDKLDTQDFEKQKKVKLQGGTWAVPVYGKIELVDNATGKVVDKQDKVKLMNIPKITPRYSYIVRGNEYQVTNQLRRMPGVYTFRKQSGDAYKSVFNLEKGRNFDINFEPNTLKYTMKIGQANPPLYPILRAIGVSDTELEKTWGREILEANRKKNFEKDVAKVAESFTGKAATIDTAAPMLQEYFKGTKLNGDLVKQLMGEKHESVTPSLMVRASKKLLDTYRGIAKPDDAESLIYKDIHGVDDYIKERLTKNVRPIQMKFKRNLDSRDKISEIVNTSFLNSQVENFFLTDERSNTPEQYNPLHMMGSHYKVTIMGPGGVTSSHMITPEMREVHTSHIGFLDPIHTPESEKVGATLHLPFSVTKDKNKLLTNVYDPKQGKIVHMSPLDMHSKKVAFPDQANFDGQKFKGFIGDKIKVQHEGELKEVSPKEVDAILPSTKSLFSFSTNMIPFLKNNQANRATFASKQIEQAVPLVREHREAPLVKTLATKSGVTFDQAIGADFSHRSPVDGTVTKVTPDAIFIKSGLKTHKVNLYHNFPLNQTTMFNSEAVHVAPGQKVKKDQLIADTNYTKDGHLALGTNLKTAYMVWPGATFEDGIAITEKAAKKLTSEHAYRYEQTKTDDMRFNLRNFQVEYPTQLTSDNSAKLDEHGVIKKGSLVKPGEILIAALKNKITTPEEAAFYKTNRAIKKPLGNAAVVYNNTFDGVVTDVLHNDKGIKVVVKTREEAKVGDKLSGLHGNKGIISAVVPDSQAPRNKDGEAVDVMLNPHGVISRINIGQLYESAAGKIAKKTGKPYLVENFDNIDHKPKIQEELKKLGLSDKEEIFDANGKKLGNIHVGYPHILKLFKTGQSVLSARGAGPGYPYDRMNMQPIKGGEEGAKSTDLLTAYSLLSHDARNILREMATFKSENSEDFWNSFRQGKVTPVPKSPFVYDKFLTMLRGAGVDVKKEGNGIQILPQTDKQVLSLSRGKIEEPEFLNGKDLKPRKGGFFDEKITGGYHGTWFNHIELPEKLPNPVFEGPIKSLTGLTSQQYNGLINGTHHVVDGKVVRGEGKITGGVAFEHLLKNINLDTEIKRARDDIKIASTTHLPALQKKLRYLNTLKENDLTPASAYIKQHVPVLPSMFRPIYPLDDGSLNVSPVNYLYQNTHLLSEAMKMPAVQRLPEHEKGTIRKSLYDHQEALAGLNDNIIVKGKNVPGLISQIAGSQPKEGFFLDKVISKRQDLTARGTIIPSSDLSVDEIGIPEKAAWPIFEPFVMQRIVRMGKTPAQAKKEIEQKTDIAKQALAHAMSERPVLYNRAPSLHKFSIMAGMPKLVQGSAIQIPHLITKGLGADFDGDAMTIHVPVLPEAVHEARGMLPSNHLFKPGTGKLMMAPAQEGALGIFMHSQTAEGRAILNKMVPKDMPINEVMDVSKMHVYLKNLAVKYPKEYASVVQKLKNSGETKAYQSGFTLGLDDLTVNKKDRDTIVNAAIARAAKVDIKDPNKKFHEYTSANKSLQSNIMDTLPKTNPLRMMVESGARGNKNQLQQILATPMILKDTKDRPILLPIKQSYVEGLPVSDYFVSLYGARKGMMDRALQTSLPGAFTKDVMASTVDLVINKDDCGVKSGIEMSVHDPHVVDRYLAHDEAGFPRNTLVTPEVVKIAERKGLKQLVVRSPLKCLQPQGICAKCFGLDEHGHAPHIGRNVGAMSGQTITEPLTQMQMSSIHTGGMAGASVEAIGFQRIQQLFNLPKKMTGVVPLSPKDGKVESVKAAPGGGHFVKIEGEEHHVPQGAKLFFKEGDHVKKGDPLAMGAVRPEDILRYKGINEAQKYITDQLRDTYKHQGADLHRKYFETVVRAVTNTTKIKNAPENAPFQAGDVAPLTMVQAYNTKNKDNPIIHEPTLIGLQRLPMTRKNWMAQLGYRYAKDTIRHGAAEGWKTDIEGLHPIPALAHGATFGQGKEGRY